MSSAWGDLSETHRKVIDGETVLATDVAANKFVVRPVTSHEIGCDPKTLVYGSSYWRLKDA